MKPSRRTLTRSRASNGSTQKKPFKKYNFFVLTTYLLPLHMYNKSPSLQITTGVYLICNFLLLIENPNPNVVHRNGYSLYRIEWLVDSRCDINTVSFQVKVLSRSSCTLRFRSMHASRQISPISILHTSPCNYVLQRNFPISQLRLHQSNRFYRDRRSTMQGRLF